jgi:hypothetical protein
MYHEFIYEKQIVECLEKKNALGLATALYTIFKRDELDGQYVFGQLNDLADVAREQYEWPLPLEAVFVDAFFGYTEYLMQKAKEEYDKRNNDL